MKWLDTATPDEIGLHQGYTKLHVFYRLQLFVGNWAFAPCQQPTRLSCTGWAFQLHAADVCWRNLLCHLCPLETVNVVNATSDCCSGTQRYSPVAITLSIALASKELTHNE